MIVVARFSYAYEAQIAKTSLETAGIHSFIADENTINMQWLYSNAMGGIRLFVEQENYELALAILNTDFSDSIKIEDEISDSSKTHCYRCGSSQLHPYTKGKKSAFFVFILLGFPLFFYKHGFRCECCHHFQQ